MKKKFLWPIWRVSVVPQIASRGRAVLAQYELGGTGVDIRGAANDFTLMKSCNLMRALIITTTIGCSGALVACSVAPGMELTPGMRHAVEARSEEGGKVEPQIRVIEIDAGAVAAHSTQGAKNDARIESLLAAPQEPYRVGPADVLQITVWDHPELAVAQGPSQTTTLRPADAPQGFVVDANGYLQFPYMGRLKVAGLNVDDIQERLSIALGEYFRAPQVTVRMASYRSKQILIDGEVHAPGNQPLNDVPMSLSDAIGRAGGFTANADQGRIVLVRGGDSYALNIPDMIQHGMNPSNLMLKSGDVLRIASRDQSGAYVLGEVAKPITAIPKQDGNLSLADALSQAGSFNLSTSNPQQLYVIRGARDGHPEVFHLDARSPVAIVMASRFQLRPDDVVYVDATDLVRVNRVLSLLLPAIDAGLTAAVVAK